MNTCACKACIKILLTILTFQLHPGRIDDIAEATGGLTPSTLAVTHHLKRRSTGKGATEQRSAVVLQYAEPLEARYAIIYYQIARHASAAAPPRAALFALRLELAGAVYEVDVTSAFDGLSRNVTIRKPEEATRRVHRASVHRPS